MVGLFNQRFSDKNFKITFGGNGTKSGSLAHPSVDSLFFPEDVASLVHSVYEDAVEDESFFECKSLVKDYILHTHDVKALFKRQRLI